MDDKVGHVSIKRASVEQEATLLRSTINELYMQSEHATDHRQLIRRLLVEAEGCVELAVRLLYR